MELFRSETAGLSRRKMTVNLQQRILGGGMMELRLLE